MDRALDLERLTEALGERAANSPRRLPTPGELQELLADAEMRIFLRQPEIPDDLIRTGWYLHGVASANADYELYPYSRQRRAFEISAHIFDLALNDQARSRVEKLSLAFGAQIGYRRAELDPNATAIFGIAAPLIIRDPPIELHVDTLALEAGVALLGLQTNILFDLYQAWLRQLRAIRRQTGVDDLWGTLFGPPHRVVAGCTALLNHLAFGSEEQLREARRAFEQVVMGDLTEIDQHPQSAEPLDQDVLRASAVSDLNAQWVAAHLLDFTDEISEGSIWRLLPPDIPDVARQAFTLASPPVLTLWPPQRLLFTPREGSQPLSHEARRVVLSIPTSSGKTLLAQLMMVVHLARGGKGVCYVAPLRSLGREVRRSLRNRLRVLARELAAELPDFGPLMEMSGMATDAETAAEQPPGTAEASVMQILSGTTSAGGLPDVEVMTPERLAHLLRRDAQAVLERFQMFVFDEAHYLAERGRGFTLESVLAFLHWKTIGTDHRIVLLSAAIGNEGQIVSWLDPEGTGVPIRSEWRGPRRLHAIFTTRPDWEKGVESRAKSQDWPVRIKYPLRGVIRLRPAEGATPRTLALAEPVGTLALRYDENKALRKTNTQSPKDSAHSTPQYKMTAQMVAALGAFGSVLVVTSTRRIAQDMAGELAEMLQDDPRTIPLADMVTQRLGSAHPLSAVLRKGVAFHHAALPVDVLEELEEALRQGALRFLTCTSTLTEGVNLPVRTVVLAETRWDDADALLSGARLVNAMGRAGRAGKESEGWIILVRAAQEHPADFALMSPARDELEIRSRLATDAALEALAEFEEAVRNGKDAAFAFAASEFSEFLSFVWFLLSSEEERGVPPQEVDLSQALRATLAFVQADDKTRARWQAVGETVRSSYIGADPQRRRRWTRAGTSIATARRLDDLAAAIVHRIQEHLEAEGQAFTDSLVDPQSALSLLAEASVFATLLSLPENERPWRFRRTRAPQSEDIVVDADALLREWVRGRSIPDLAESFLGDVPEQDWRVEQVVDAVTQQFEHFLAWTLGVLVELVNDHLGRSSSSARLCEELPSYVRYGVHTEVALRLLVSGVRSRRLAHEIALEAAGAHIEGDSLRQWLGRMEIAELRRRFTASSSELLDLLEFTRPPRTSVLRDLLEQGRAEIAIQRVRYDRGHVDDGGLAADVQSVADQPIAERPEQVIHINLRPVPGEELPRRLGIFSTETNELVARVPTSAYGDIQSILDTGVPTSGTVREETLELKLAPEAAA